MVSVGRQAEGSIRPFRGKWRARIAGEFLGVFDTYEEAADAIVSWKGLAAQDRGEAGAIVTLRSFGEQWLNQREAEGLVRSIAKERSTWEAHVCKAAFIDWPIKRISQHDLQKWLRQLAQTEAMHCSVVGRRRGVPIGSVGPYRGRWRARVRHELIGIYDTREAAEHALREWRAGQPDNEEPRKVLTPTGEFLSQSTIGNIRHVLNQCLNQAVVERKILNNPLADLRLGVKARVIENDEESWTYLAEAEIASVMRVLPDARRKAFFAVAIYAGLRQGEILGLRWRDVVFAGDNSELQVRRTRNGPPKSPKSRRTVPMLYPLHEALQEWKAEVDLEAVRGRRSRDVVVNLDRLVFPSDHGGCYAAGYDCGWADRRYRKKPTDELPSVYSGWRSKAGIQRTAVTFHCLRHTCASMLVMGGRDFPRVDKERIATWLGHASTRVTDRYVHLDPAYLREPVGRLFRFRIEEESQRAANDAEG